MGAGGAVADDPAHRAWYYVDADERTDEVRGDDALVRANARSGRGGRDRSVSRGP